MHLSDLHRNEDGLVENDQLITSLLLDSDNYTKEHLENIERPSVIVISGDVVYGSSNSDNDIAIKEAKEQYSEAISFLNMLALEFLDGDKNRIIIIPGNHDIQWNTSMSSMTKIDHSVMSTSEQKLFTEDISDPKKSIRWSWRDLNFYQIANEQMYNERLDLFSQFYEEFYEGKRKYSLDPAEQFDIFDLPEYNLTIVGYNSCFRNDHINRSGLMNSRCLANSYAKVRELQKRGRLLIATWHHNFSGIPSDNTYLDPRQLKTINSYGFLIGFHGHQHRSDIIDSYVQLDDSKKLIVISAGTLCSARSHLPTGYKRQYNLVEIDYIQETCNLFSRESIGNMEDIPIWDKGRINESLNSSLKLEIEFPKQTTTVSLSVAQVDSLTILLRQKNFQGFLDLIKDVPRNDQIVRSLLLEFEDLTNGQFREVVCQYLDMPISFEEQIVFLDFYIEKRLKDKADSILQEALLMNAESPLIVKELNKYKSRILGYGK